MASRKIRRIIELILDQAGARRAERAMQKALRDGTDPKTAARNLSVVERGMLGLRRAASLFAGAFGAGLIFRKIVTESVKAQAAIGRASCRERV